MGRIEHIDDRITVFKNGEVTCEIASPWEAAYMFEFPRTVQPVHKLDVESHGRYMDSHDDIWMNARYADLFAEPLRTDGALAEQIAVVLMARFSADPIGFLRAMGIAPENQADTVCDSLAYNADYGDLSNFRYKES